MGEGKTSAIANIGTALAQNGLKILLIDGDLRLPQLETFFNLKKTHHGLVDVIWGKRSPEEVILQPLENVPSLHILPPGILPPLPSAVFNSAPYAALLQYLSKRYDYVLIDTPPLIFASELMAIAKHADGLVINIRAGVTTKGSFRELLDNLLLAKINILGVIFNGVLENRAGGHYTGGRYYAYKNNYYAKRYYEGKYAGTSDQKTPAKGSLKTKRRGQRPTLVRGGYRSNFLKDLKRRESPGMANPPIHPAFCKAIRLRPNRSAKRPSSLPKPKAKPVASNPIETAPPGIFCPSSKTTARQPAGRDRTKRFCYRVQRNSGTGGLWEQDDNPDGALAAPFHSQPLSNAAGR